MQKNVFSVSGNAFSLGSFHLLSITTKKEIHIQHLPSTHIQSKGWKGKLKMLLESKRVLQGIWTKCVVSKVLLLSSSCYQIFFSTSIKNLKYSVQDPRPHISLAWSIGDTADSLKKVVDDEIKKCVTEKSLKKCIFTCKFKGIECKIGQKTYKICKISDRW